MGGHRPPVVHQRDRQSVLVAWEHAIGCFCLPGERLAASDHDGYGSSGFRYFDLVVSEAREERFPHFSYVTSEVLEVGVK